METFITILALIVAAAVFAVSFRGYRRTVKRLESSPSSTDDDDRQDDLELWNQAADALELVPFKHAGGIRRATGYRGDIETLPVKLRLVDRSPDGRWEVTMHCELPFPWNALAAGDGDVAPFDGLRPEVSLSGDKSITDVALSDESLSRFHQLTAHRQVTGVSTTRQALEVTTRWWESSRDSLAQMFQSVARRVTAAVEPGVELTVESAGLDSDTRVHIQVVDTDAGAVSQVQIHCKLSAPLAEQVHVHLEDEPDAAQTADAAPVDDLSDQLDDERWDRIRPPLRSLAREFRSVQIADGALVTTAIFDAYGPHVDEQFERIDEMVERVGGVALELGACCV